MASKCNVCGCTATESFADAKTLGLDEEFQNGIYTCCQVAEWAHEQWLAWFEAIDEDSKSGSERTLTADDSEEETVVVPFRFRRPVPWFRRV